MAFGVDRRTGKLRWVYDSKTDIHHGWWPALAYGYVVVNDDGLFVLDPRDGTKRFPLGFDWWGDLLFDGKHLALTNVWHVHGPFPHVGAYDAQFESRWRIEHELQAQDYQDHAGTLASRGGRLFVAQKIQFTQFRGVFALDWDTGKELWNYESTPVGGLSLDDDRVFFVERRSGSYRLVALDQKDGRLQWEQETERTDGASPCVFGGRLWSYLKDGRIVVRDSRSGEVRKTLGIQEGKLDQFPPRPHDTHMAIAARSNTAVVAAGKNFSLLELNGLKTVWRGPTARKRSGYHSPIIDGEGVVVVRDGCIEAWRCTCPPPKD